MVKLAGDDVATLLAELDGTRTWAVTVRGKRYKAAQYVDDGNTFRVVNSRGQEIVAFGELWLRVVALCTAAARSASDAKRLGLDLTGATYTGKQEGRGR